MTKTRRPPDDIIVELAARRRGVCTRRELLASGVEKSAIARRTHAGRLDRVANGIYVVPALAGRFTPHEVALAAAPDGALSHFTAANIHGFPLPSTSLHLTVPKGLDNKVPDFIVHETRRWRQADIVERFGMRVTSPARTLCDLAGVLGAQQLRFVVQRQLLEGVPTDVELDACSAEIFHPNAPGAVNMCRLLADLFDFEPYPQSELELRVFDALASKGVVGVHRQYRPPWYDGIRGIVDGADPHSRTIIEADGRRWHVSSQARAEDSRRDRLAAANGWLVVRLSWADITERPTSTIDELCEILSSRAAATAQIPPAA